MEIKFSHKMIVNMLICFEEFEANVIAEKGVELCDLIAVIPQMIRDYHQTLNYYILVPLLKGFENSFPLLF